MSPGDAGTRLATRGSARPSSFFEAGSVTALIADPMVPPCVCMAPTYRAGGGATTELFSGDAAVKKRHGSVTHQAGSLRRGRCMFAHRFGDRPLARILVEVEVDHGCDEERDHLGEEQAAHDGEAERLAQLRAGAEPRGDGNRAHRGGHG